MSEEKIRASADVKSADVTEVLRECLQMELPESQMVARVCSAEHRQDLGGITNPSPELARSHSVSSNQAEIDDLTFPQYEIKKVVSFDSQRERKRKISRSRLDELEMTASMPRAMNLSFEDDGNVTPRMPTPYPERKRRRSSVMSSSPKGQPEAMILQMSPISIPLDDSFDEFKEAMVENLNRSLSDSEIADHSLSPIIEDSHSFLNNCRIFTSDSEENASVDTIKDE